MTFNKSPFAAGYAPRPEKPIVACNLTNRLHLNGL
jgi:hypothetical protein